MTFLELFNLVKMTVWPETIAANLVVRAKSQLQTYMTDLQSAVPMLQGGNTIVYPQNSTLWRCGLTTFAAPLRMSITAVDIIATDAQCCAIRAAATHPYLMRCRGRYCASSVTPPSTTIDSSGDYAADSTNDHKYSPTSYSVALYDDRLWVYPWISSNLSVRVTYRGIKRRWADSDLLPDSWLVNGEIDPELLDYLRWALELTRRDVLCDTNKFQIANLAFADRRQRLMYDEQRNEQLRLQLDEPCLDTCWGSFKMPTSTPPVVPAPPGSQLGDSIYQHPDSRKWYYCINGLYYLITPKLVDGVPVEDVSEVGITPPV